MTSTCGDGFVWNTDGGNEQCDDGNNDNTDGCLNSCQTAVCGDGYVHSGVEECDNGAANSNDAACTASCNNAECGDGLVGPGEECDDGNTNDGDACDSSCQWENPVATFTSSVGASGSIFTSSSKTISVTATFTVAVAGVSKSDFGLNDGGASLTTSLASASGGSSDVTWVLTLTMTQDANATLSFTMPASSGSILDGAGLDTMAATNNGFMLVYITDCSGAPHCATQHRGLCGSVPHTCTACLAGFSGPASSNDMCAGASTVVQSDGTTSVAEDGGSDTFTVALAVDPLDDVAVTITFNGSSRVTVSPTSFTLSSTAPVTVTVTGISNTINDGDATARIVVEYSSTDTAFAPPLLPDDIVWASVIENDPDCDGVTQCASLNRVACSQTTGTCGVCRTGYAGTAGDSNDQCLLIPVPTFTSSQGGIGAKVFSNQLSFTATFTRGVTGVAASDFNVVVSDGYAFTTSAPASSSGGTVWTMSVTITDPVEWCPETWPRVTVSMAENSGSITDDNGAATNSGFYLQFQPAAPTVTSTVGAANSVTDGTVLPFRFTFASPVRGLTQSDFTLSAGSVASNASLTTTPTTAEYNVTLQSGFARTPVSVVLPACANSGGSSAGLTLVFQPVSVVISGGVASTNEPTMYFIVNFSQPVTGLAPSDFAVDAGDLTATVQSVTPETSRRLWAKEDEHARRLATTASLWRVVVALAGEFKRQPVTLGITEGKVSPVNMAVPATGVAESDPQVVVYDPPTADPTLGEVLGADTGSQTVVVPETESNILDVEIDFGAPVSGVTAANFLVNSEHGDVTYDVVPVDGLGTPDSPARKWRLTVRVPDSMPDSRITVTMNNDNGEIYPPPAHRTSPVLDVQYTNPTTFSWLLVLFLCCLVVLCCVAVGLAATKCCCGKPTQGRMKVVPSHPSMDALKASAVPQPVIAPDDFHVTTPGGFQPQPAAAPFPRAAPYSPDPAHLHAAVPPASSAPGATFAGGAVGGVHGTAPPVGQFPPNNRVMLAPLRTSPRPGLM